MLQAETKIAERTVKAKGRPYSQLYIYLPQDLVKDSQFPFKANDIIQITAEGKKLIIEKK